MYGEPSHVVAFAVHQSGEVHGLGRDLELIFQSQGFAVSVPNIPVTLSPDMMVTHPTFFVPTELGRIEALNVAPEFISPWQGFKDYTFYCHDSEEGQACRNE